jgi:DNA-binding response OmpR family regulator
MMEAQEPSGGSETRLSRARGEFVSTLGRRLTALRNTLHQLEDDPGSPERRDMLLRRVHALGAAARVLGFDGVADALDEAERALARSAGGGPVDATDLAEVSRALDVLPSIAWGAKVPSRASVEPSARHELVELGWPLSILVYGPPALRGSLVASEEALVECELAEDAETFRELAQQIGPDVAVIDGDLRGAKELLEALAHDGLIEPFPVIVVGTFDQPEAASSYVALGAARVLPKPVSPDALQRAVLDTSQHESGLRGPREPIGDVTVDELAARVGAEVRRGLVDAAEPGGEGVSVPLGEGTDVLAAVWGAVARIRELLTMRSGGAVRFHAGGPEGAVPLAPWTAPERLGGERGRAAFRRTDGVSLEGRRAVVVDDDPAVVWFLSGLLRTSGVEVAEAHDGRRAKEMVFDALPDLLVSDVLMPELDGFSLCRAIKRDVAARDIPVILLSWKEDLLQRVRELGAGADGYLRKEAAASTVLTRIREVLRPRARVEARLAGGGEVRGRLDGFTPRLLIQLAARHQPNSRVIVRDAVYLYELELRDGAPRRVTRTATDGSFERGERVLDSLIGVSAGRFVVSESRAACRDEIKSTLEEALRVRIARARTLLALVDGRELDRIDSLVIDRDAVGAYLGATPDPARRAFERMLAGTSPRELCAREPSSRHFIEQVLADIARRGAIREVVRDGVRLNLDALTTPPPPAALAESPAAPLFTLELSPAPPEVAEAVKRWERGEPASSGPSARLPLSRAVTPMPVQIASAPAPESAFRDEPRTNPGVGPPAVLSPAPVIHAPRPEPRGGEPTSSDDAPVLELASAFEAKEESEPMQEQAILLTSRSPKQSATTQDVDSGWEPMPGGVELPASAFPSASDRGNVELSLPPRESHDYTPSTLRVDSRPEELEPDAPPPAPDRDAETVPASAEPPAAKAVTAEKPRKRREHAPTLPSARPISFPRGRTDKSSPSKPAPERLEAPVRPPKRASQPEEAGLGAGKIALLTLAAAAASFGVVTLLRGASAPEQSVSTAAPTASVAAPPVVKPVAQAVRPQSEELVLPPGVPVDRDKGLLEVDIGEKNAIYVDGTFVGRGPTRRVPLAAGSHQVVLKAPDGESTVAVEIKVGRRTRVTVPTLK